METLQNIFQAEIIQRLGWTLVHFVWQATAIGLILAIVLKLLHKSSASLRYIIACMALCLIVLMPAVTIRMVDVAVYTVEPANPIAVDLPKAGADTVVAIPKVESPPAAVAVTPQVPLKDRFIEVVEPALPYVVVGWLVGVFGLSLWHLGGWAQLQRLRRRMVKQAAPILKEKLQQLSDMLGIRKAIELVESALVQVPTVVGHLKPVILLPASALTGLSPEQVEAILAHELAHIKRCDYLVNMLQTVVEILGFYHPAVWWVSHRIRVERENCCDDLAVSLCSDRVCYARALTTMEEIRAGQLTLAVAASGGSLFGRIRRLLGKDTVGKEKADWIPSAIAILLITALVIPASWALSGKHQEKSDLELSKPRVYQVNRVVADFPEDDFSTPEAAYAAINKIADHSDNSQWAKVSVKRLARRFPQSKSRKSKPDVEWSKVLQNAQILEVRVYQENYAMVIAKLPQEFSSKKIRSPIDLRSLELENGRWLNAGNSRCWKVEEARARFAEACEFREEEARREIIREEKIKGAIKHPEEIVQTAQKLFQDIRDAEYEHVLSYYSDGKWREDGWKKFELNYTVYTDWPNFALWACRTFKNNPIVSVKLGKVFISDKEIWDKTGYPSVHYKLTLQDGSILEGDLPFEYSFKEDEGHWHPIHGIDWHLQDEPIKSPETQSADSSSAPQILTTGYILSVPEDLPELKGIISEDKSEAKMITPEKLEEFRNVIRTVSGAKVIATPKLLTNDGEVGETRTENAKDFESIKLNIKNAIQPDRKTITLDLDFEYTRDEAGDQKTTHVSAKATTLSEHAIAVAGNLADKDQILLLIVKPRIVEAGQFSKTGVVQTENHPGKIEKFKQQLEEPVTVHVDKSPDGDRLTIQYAAMAVCKAAGVPYNWDRSAELGEPERRQYVEPVNIEDKVASQAIADMAGPVGLLYGLDADGVYLYKSEKAVGIKSNLEVLNIELELVVQGKNVLYATVKNSSDTEQLFGIHIYTRSVDYGPDGIGWGTPFFEKLKANETKRARFVYKIQGPVTENTYIRVKFYNPATEKEYNYDKPFAIRVYKSGDLPRLEIKTVRRQWTGEEMSEEIFKTFKHIQTLIKKKDYEKAWELFTKDYQRVEYQRRGLERFKLHMEPEHPLHAAFHWDKKTFVKLKRKRLEASTDNLNDRGAKLTAEHKSKKWTIYFVYDSENNKWKIDDILGYRPAILDM
jgi:beta-lactamase regulating signal transducer with metallopeptidase domain